ncbi:MAG: acyl-CoA thioesterase/bile acid-CoA:amino acid N-acyltransferase family protein [Pseudomonadota bacterium]
MRLLIAVFQSLFLFSLPAFAQLAINVEPADRLWMEDPEITVMGAEPGAPVTIIATLTDDKGQVWSSRGEYFADSNGQIELDTDASLSGTYRGVDVHGPFWSLLPMTPEQVRTLTPEQVDPLAPRTPQLSFVGSTDVQIITRSDKSVASADQNVGFLSVGVRVEDVDEAGLRGKFLTPIGDEPRPAILVVTGSGGGVNLRTAALLASKGFHVFALAHFNYPGRPPELKDIPLEYFETAIGWLRQKAGTDKIGLTGLSRGGEGALLIASLYPDHIGAVVSGVPSNVLWGGCCTADAVKAVAWRLNGKPLPISPYPFKKGEEGFEYLSDSVGFRDFYMPGMAASSDSNPATIAVENIDAPILLISGAADMMWPSSIAAQRIEQRLKEKDYIHSFESVVYPSAGHHVTSDVFVTIRSSEVVHPVTKTKMYLGGLPEANAANSRDAFRRKVAFFKKYLAIE